MQEECPFEVGDIVVYHPSEKGWGYEVMSSEPLVRGCEYVVCRIDKGVYVVVCGHAHPGGGLYWTEFQKKEETSNSG
jgi:hypothetical protein